MQNMFNEIDSPAVSIVVSTRNRPDDIKRATASILKCSYPDYKLVVIDQSDDDITYQILEPVMNDPKLIYVRSKNKGLNNGRNEGVQATQAELMVFTDDDCEVPESWIQDIVTAFKVDPKIGLIFGNVLEADYDKSKGVIPHYNRTKPFLGKSIADKRKIYGMGACFALRRSAWEAIGGFDPCLGVGAVLKAGDDDDLPVKILKQGFYVYETPEVYLTHYGFRDWDQLRELIKRDFYGLGAMFPKYIKLGYRPIYLVFATAFYNYVLKKILITTFKERRPKGLVNLVYFFKGFFAALKYPIDKSTLNYTMKLT